MDTEKQNMHGHEVMDMMRTSNKPYTRSELVNAITTTFGEHTTFETCAAKDLSANGLIDFLFSRGKLSENDNGIQLSAPAAESESCSH